MNADPDDDALSWDGDEDAGRSGLPKGRRAAGDGTEQVVSRSADSENGTAGPTDVEDEADADHPDGLGNATLLALGVLGGVYLLYTIGWVVGGLRLKALAPLIVSDAMYLPWFVLAVAAPALWFLTTWVCTRRSATWVRMGILAAGAVLLIPWPFVMMGALGA